MKLTKLAGATSAIWQVFIRDSSSTTGGGLTGLTNASPSLTAYYHRDTDTTATVISLVSMTVGTFTSSGFKEIDATNMPGWYQFCPPNAALASGAKSCAFHLKGATNMAPLPIEVQLVAYNPDDAVRLGLTALPNAAAEASGGLPTLSAAQASNGTINANVHRWLTGTPNALQSGRVDGYLGAAASGVIAAATFAANALDAVWSTAARLLTAGTNIVLAKGTGVTGFNDLDASGVRSAVGLASANLDTQLDALPTNAELATALGTADDAVLAAIAGLNNLSQANIRTAIGLGSANLDTQLAALAVLIGDVPTNAELATALGDADDATLAAIAGLNNLSQANIRTALGLGSANLDTQLDALPTNAELATALAASWTTALTEAYAADGVAPTPAQALFLIMQSLHEFAIAGTTRTVKKLDGATTAATFTLDDATNPTSTTRAT